MGVIQPEVEEAGVETALNHLVKAFHTKSLVQVLETTLDETLNDGGGFTYHSKAKIKEKSNTSYNSGVNQLADDDHYFVGCRGDDFEALAHLGVLELHDHLSGTYRIKGDRDYEDWLRDIRDDLGPDHPTEAPPEDEPHRQTLRQRMGRMGLNLLSKQDSQKYRKYEDEIPGGFKDRTPREVETARKLEEQIDVWPENVEHDCTFEKVDGASSKDWHLIEHQITVTVSKYKGTDSTKLSDEEIDLLIRDMDLRTLQRIVELLDPIFDEEDTSFMCSCPDPRTHLLRSASLNLSFAKLPNHIQMTKSDEEIKEMIQSGEIDVEDDDICLRALDDSFERVEFVNTVESNFEFTYGVRLNKIQFVSQGGRT